MSIAEEVKATARAASHGQDQKMLHPGLTLAKVTNITDPDKLNRVKCMPVENSELEETDWCYVMAPLGGKSCGQFFFPNVDDLVVLAYLGGDLHRPMVIGAYWDSAVTPPYSIEDGKVFNFSIKTPQGTELLFYDEADKQKVTLTLPSGAMLTIDDEGKKAALQDKEGKNALTMDFGGSEVTLKADTKVTIAAGGTQLVLESSGNITQTGSGTVSIEGATLKLKGSNSAGMEGSSAEIKSSGELKLEAGGNATLKGTMVNIN